MRPFRPPELRWSQGIELPGRSLFCAVGDIYPVKLTCVASQKGRRRAPLICPALSRIPSRVHGPAAARPGTRHEGRWLRGRHGRFNSVARFGARLHHRDQLGMVCGWCAGALGAYAQSTERGATYLDHARSQQLAVARGFFGPTGGGRMHQQLRHNAIKGPSTGC